MVFTRRKLLGELLMRERHPGTTHRDSIKVARAIFLRHGSSNNDSVLRRPPIKCARMAPSRVDVVLTADTCSHKSLKLPPNVWIGIESEALNRLNTPLELS